MKCDLTTTNKLQFLFAAFLIFRLKKQQHFVSSTISASPGSGSVAGIGLVRSPVVAPSRFRDRSMVVEPRITFKLKSSSWKAIDTNCQIVTYDIYMEIFAEKSLLRIDLSVASDYICYWS